MNSIKKSINTRVKQRDLTLPLFKSLDSLLFLKFGPTLFVTKHQIQIQKFSNNEKVYIVFLKC